jgi:hypothetical protein
MLVKGIVTTGDISVVTIRADIIFPITIPPTTIDTIHILIGIPATQAVAGSALVSFLINRIPGVGIADISGFYQHLCLHAALS